MQAPSDRRITQVGSFVNLYIYSSDDNVARFEVITIAMF